VFKSGDYNVIYKLFKYFDNFVLILNFYSLQMRSVIQDTLLAGQFTQKFPFGLYPEGQISTHYPFVAEERTFFNPF